MADEEKEQPEGEGGEDEQPKKKKLPMTVILIVVGVIVAFLLVGGITYFMVSKLVGDMAAGGGGGGGNAGGGGGGEFRHSDPGVFVKLGDAKEGILVNVGGAKAGKFLKTSIIVEVNPEKEEIIHEGKMTPSAETVVLDTTMQILRSSSLDEFDADKQDDLKKKIKEQLNQKLGMRTIYDVYITSFLLQ